MLSIKRFDNSNEQKILHSWNTGSNLSRTVKRFENRIEKQFIINVWRDIYKQLKGCTASSIPNEENKNKYVVKYDQDWYPSWRGSLHSDGTPLIFIDTRK